MIHYDHLINAEINSALCIHLTLLKTWNRVTNFEWDLSYSMICLDLLTTVHYCNCMTWYHVIRAWQINEWHNLWLPTNWNQAKVVLISCKYTIEKCLKYVFKNMARWRKDCWSHTEPLLLDLVSEVSRDRSWAHAYLIQLPSLGSRTV